MKIRDLELIASLGDDYEYDNQSSNEGVWCLDVYKYDKAPHGTIAFYSDDNIRYGLTFDYTFDDVSKLLQVMQEMKEKDDYHDVQCPFDEYGIDLDAFEWVPMPARCRGRHINAEEVEEVKVEELEETAMTIANTAVVSVNAKEEVKMNKRYVIAMVIGSVVNMTQINAVKTWLTKNAKASVDIIVSGNPIRVQKLGCVINELKTPIRMIGCGVKNNDIFAYTHQDEHPCVWAINHSDVVITIGDGMVVTEAKKYAFKTNRSYYSYSRQFVESICKGHYEKAVITRADIVTTNEAATATKQAVKEAADPMVAAKKELEVAKKEFEAAKAKLDAAQAKVDALAKPVEEKKEEVIEGRGAELFVDVELSPNMGAITAAAQDDYGYKSIAQEIEEAVNDDSDEILEAGENFAYGRTSYTVVTAFNITELEMAQMDSPDAARKIVEDAVANGSLKLAVPELISFEFEGKSYFIEDKEAFDMDIFDSCDAETQKMIIKESAAAGHIVAA